MDEMIKMLADSPEDQRKQMMTERFTMIASQPEEQRIQTVKEIVLAISRLDPPKRKAFIRTRTNVVAESPEDIRKAIQMARVKAGSLVPMDVNQEDMMHILDATKEWPEEKRNIFMMGMKATFQELGMEMPDMDAMMKKGAEAKAEPEKPWWKFW